MGDLAGSSKRARAEENASDIEGKRIRSDPLLWLDDPDPDHESQDLDSIMKSLESELSASSSSSAVATSSCNAQPELGYLFEASDDELGLPPPKTLPDQEREPELARVESDSSGIGELWDLEDAIPYCDSFDFDVSGGYNTDYLPLGGLFEYSDLLPGPLPAE